MVKDYNHSDRELFLLIAGGDQGAYAKIYQKYTGRLYSYVLKVLKSELWAEEIVHDIFLNLWLKRENLNTVENPAAYLYRITANKTVDWVRRRYLELKIVYYSQRRIPNGVNDNEQLLDSRQCESLIKEAVDKLAPKRKLIYRLKYEEGLSYDEIASTLEISSNTVRNQLAKSIEVIRIYLRQKGDISFMILIIALSK